MRGVPSEGRIFVPIEKDNVFHYRASTNKRWAKNNCFIDSRINGCEFQMLCDTGNLSNVDLIDTQVFYKAFPGENRPQVHAVNSPIRTAGQYKLRQRGKFRAQLQIGDSSDIWETDAYLVDNLGCLLYTSPSPRDGATSRMPSSA